MDEQDRLAELRGKKQLTDAEIDELGVLSPTFVHMPALTRAGPVDLSRAISNLLEIGARFESARSAGFFVECIALRSQLAELFLRLYIATKTGNDVGSDGRVKSRV